MIDFFNRLDKYMKYKGLNDNKITVETGISNGLIGKARKKGGGLSTDNISKILHTYRDLSADWLLTGNGVMLHDNTPKPAQTEINLEKILDIMHKQADSLERRDNQIDELIAQLKKGNAHADEDVRCAAANK